MNVCPLNDDNELKLLQAIKIWCTLIAAVRPIVEAHLKLLSHSVSALGGLSARYSTVLVGIVPVLEGSCY